MNFFLTLARLRVNIPEKVLADNYKITVAEVSRIFVTWLDLIYSRLVQLPTWASKNTVQKTMPECFREKYPLTRVIIDCTEILIENHRASELSQEDILLTKAIILQKV